MDFENIRFDQSHLLKLWKECKSEVEELHGEQVEDYESDAKKDNHRHDDDVNQEIKFLKDKIKNLKYREEDMEDEIGNLEYKNEKLEKEINNLTKKSKDVHKALEEKIDIEKEYKEHKNVSDNIIKQLQKANEELKQKVESMLEKSSMEDFEKEQADKKSTVTEQILLTEQIKELSREIERLRVENEEKSSHIIALAEEKEIALKNLQDIEMEKKTEKTTINPISLHEELCMSLDEHLFNNFKCNKCEKFFGNNNDLKNHKRLEHEQEKEQIERYLLQLENKFAERNLMISKSIIKLKEKEQKESHYCLSKTRCRIYHHKHNWSRPKSLDIMNTLEKLEQNHQNIKKAFSCKHCVDTFADYCDLRLHMETTHRQVGRAKANAFSIETTSNDETNLGRDAEDILDDISNEDQQDDGTNTGTKPKQYSCEICDNIFDRRWDLEKHMQTKHDSKQSAYDPHVLIQNLCDICLISFENEAELKKHTVKHSRNGKIQSILKQ